MRYNVKPITCFCALLSVLLLCSLTDITSAQLSPSLDGCSILPANNIWNAPIDQLPADPNSSSYVNTIGASTGLHPDFGSGTWDGGPIGIPYNVVPGSQPKVDITFDYSDESVPGPYPIPPDPQIEGGVNSTGDRHILVLDKDRCILYETWPTYPQLDGAQLSAHGPAFPVEGIF